MTHPITQRAALKGWTATEIAERWGLTPRTFSRQAKDPSQQFVDAVEGLPTFEDEAAVINVTWGWFEGGWAGHIWRPAPLLGMTAAEQFACNEKRGRFDGLNIINRGEYDGTT